METIVGVAIIGEGGEVWTLPKPNRHWHVIGFMAESGHPTPVSLGKYPQGFVTDTGRFIGRAEAAGLALANGQCAELYAPPDLYSEDLW